MTRLAITSTLLGGLLVLTRLPGVVAPAKFREHMVRFPRSVLWGRVLMGIVAAIAWAVMYRAATDDWAWARPLILIGVPAAYFMVINYGTHFLALRATAALMLLAAKQMVDATDLSDVPSRLIVTVFAYVWVVIAIWVTVSPHQFRDVIAHFMADDKRCRTVCAFGVIVGAMFLGLGLFVY